jgi:ATP-dependent DNA ligase
MLAELAPAPFDSENHIFEPKWDGVRCLAYLRPDGLRLDGRKGNDLTPLFPELHRGVFDAPPSILDGELICGDGSTRTFPLVQGRVHRGDTFAIRMGSRTHPATFMAFDILEVGGRKVTSLPLRERKALLSTQLRESERVSLTPFFEGKGCALFEAMTARGYEGVMAKHKQSPYLPGKRSGHWLKVKVARMGEFLAVGLTRGKGSRQDTFGALVLAAQEGKRLAYRGEVGSGFSDEELKVVLGLVRDAPPTLALPLKDVRWIEPIRCRVKFLEESEDGKLRFPVFAGIVGGERANKTTE